MAVIVDRLRGAAEMLQAFLVWGTSVSPVKVISADSQMSLPWTPD